jgi:fructokinase
MEKIFGSIELGGTKTVCAIGKHSGEILDQITIPTTNPKETMSLIIRFFKDMEKKVNLSAIGIASFGVLELNKKSKKYGHLGACVKRYWADFDLLGSLKRGMDVPIGIDTDVNGAALGEYVYGAGKGLESLVYWTVGTGIGGGMVKSGDTLHGLLHTEMGHTYVPQDKLEDPFEGVCMCHGDCLEGLASGPSMMKRWKLKAATDLPKGHVGWDLEARYLAYAMVNTVLMLSPDRIIIGGGVMKHEELYPKIRKKTLEFLKGFIRHETILKKIDEYIVPPALGPDSGIWGGIVLAEKAFRESY